MLDIFLTDNEISKIFTFINLNEDNVIDNFEFMDFFIPTFPVYENEEEIIDYEKLKADILEHLAF